jgi:hypothetical protein
LALDFLWLLLVLLGWAALICVYVAPTVVAFRRNVVNKWSVGVINILLGWTLIGWAVALAMAVRTEKVPKHLIPVVRDQGRYSRR